MPSVLVVDDEPAILRLLSAVIGTLGLDTIPAETAEHALEFLDSKVPDLIISDVRLPGISGDELAKRVKSNPCLTSVPILLISAYQEPANHKADAFIPKPFDLDRLLETVETYIK